MAPSCVTLCKVKRCVSAQSVWFAADKPCNLALQGPHCSDALQVKCWEWGVTLCNWSALLCRVVSSDDVDGPQTTLKGNCHTGHIIYSVETDGFLSGSYRLHGWARANRRSVSHSMLGGYPIGAEELVPQWLGWEDTTDWYWCIISCITKYFHWLS